MNERERDVEKKKKYNLFQKRTIFSLFFLILLKKS